MGTPVKAFGYPSVLPTQDLLSTIMHPATLYSINRIAGQADCVYTKHPRVNTTGLFLCMGYLTFLTNRIIE